MANPCFPDAALLLLGHGSSANADSAASVYQHAGELRRRRVFGEVAECFLKQAPYLPDVLSNIQAPRVFLIPLFISEGYFTTQSIPRELGLRIADDASFPQRQQRGRQTLLYGGPVGTHETMTDVILARAREVVAEHPFPRAPKESDLTLFIAGHGTGSHDNSRKAAENQAQRIARQGIYRAVHAVFIEEAPRIGDCYGMADTRNLVMVPFFVSDGLHSREDIPKLLGEPKNTVQERLQQNQPTWRNPTERNGKRVWYSSSVGSDPRIAEVILERVREAASLTG